MKNFITISLLLLSNQIFGQDTLSNPSKPINGMTINNPTSGYLDSAFTFSKKEIDKSSVESEFLIILNSYRKFYGLDSVVLDPTLSMAAEIQSKYQAQNRIVSHTNTNKNYEYPYDRIKSVGIIDQSRSMEICVKVVKIVSFYRGRTVSEDALDRWVNSSSHNEAMLWKDAKIVGISFYQSPTNNGEVYATVIFL
jgi:uncharacterized protein YkwD